MNLIVPTLADRIFRFRPLHAAVRADLVAMSPYFLLSLGGTAAAIVVIALDAMFEMPLGLETFLPISGALILLTMSVFLGAMLLQPFMHERQDETMRQLLAQPVERLLIWLPKVVLSVLLGLVIVAGFILVLKYAFVSILSKELHSSQYAGTFQYLVFMILISFWVLASSAAVVSLYFSSGGSLLVLLGLYIVFWILVFAVHKIFVSVPILDFLQLSKSPAAWWMVLPAWVIGCYTLSYLLFRRMEVR